MVSQIPVPIHIFWQTMAIVSGGVLALWSARLLFVKKTNKDEMKLFLIYTLLLGLGTFFVDYWFLSNI